MPAVSAAGLRAHRADPLDADGATADALNIDRRVRALNAREAACRAALGELAHHLCRRRTYHRLGFARLGDYTRERLGLSRREVESLAQVTVALRRLPATAAVFARGELSWTHTRLVTTVATAETEHAWLERARRCSAVELATIVRRTAADTGDAHARVLLTGDTRVVYGALDDASDLADGEAPARFRLRCPPRLRALFYDTVELARRVAGAALPIAHAVEAIAAEAFSGAPGGFGDVPSSSVASIDSPHTPAARWVAPSPSAPGSPSQASSRGAPDWPSPFPSPAVPDSPSAAPSDTAMASTLRPPAPAGPLSNRFDSASLSAPDTPAVVASAFGGASLSPSELDTRLRAAVATLRSIDGRMGGLLEVVRRQGIHRRLGFASLAEFLRDRVGIAPRTARALMAAERTASCHAALSDAYRAGDLSWLQVLTLAPVLANAPESVVTAWIARARRVTLRRLTDEVTWALGRRDCGAPGAAEPPPPDAHLDDDEWQIRAHTQAEPHGDAGSLHGDDRIEQRQIGAPGTSDRADPALDFVGAEITFTGLASIVALFHAAITAFARPRDARGGSTSRPEPAWRSCERMLRHVRATWLALPRHRDPIFQRDGWRCTVPACSGRRHLHDHHLRFRSRGGDNHRTNRTSVCASHHLHGIHAGFVRAWGTAPAAIRWQLGIANHSSWALLDFLGDRYLDHDEVVAERQAHGREMAERLRASMPSDVDWEADV